MSGTPVAGLEAALASLRTRLEPLGIKDVAELTRRLGAADGPLLDQLSAALAGWDLTDTSRGALAVLQTVPATGLVELQRRYMRAKDPAQRARLAGTLARLGGEREARLLAQGLASGTVKDPRERTETETALVGIAGIAPPKVVGQVVGGFLTGWASSQEEDSRNPSLARDGWAPDFAPVEHLFTAFQHRSLAVAVAETLKALASRNELLGQALAWCRDRPNGGALRS